MDAAGPLTFNASPELRDPILIMGYAGWNDGGESATEAVRYLSSVLDTRLLAQIEMEEFLDLTVARPHVRLSSEGSREVVWPNHEFFSVRLEGRPHDLILGLGMEPHLRWKTYCRTLGELVRRTGVRLVVLPGAFLADVIYSQPIQVRSFTTGPRFSEALGEMPSQYEGPTGIVGVLADELSQQGIPTLSLWAALPHYITVSPNRRGALALLQQLGAMTQIPFDLGGLEQSAADFDEKVSELIAADPQLSDYVRELKRRAFSQ
ncbi:MAG: PAC2 family protein [Myxococcales bacterium]|nr:PAC2 family protein [Myxococcales bacterium]